MQRLRARCLLGVCLAVAHMPLHALAPELMQALDRFDQAVSLSSATSNDRQRGAEVALAYERHVAPWVADKTALDASARHRLFRAVHAAYFYTLSDDLIPDLEASFDRLRADGAERPEETRQMAAAFVASRQFERAQTLRREAGMEAGPPLEVQTEGAGAGPRVIRFLSQRKAVVEPWRAEDISVLVVAHPGCGFSRAALAAIGQDLELRRWLSRHGMFLAPQDQTEDLAAFARWAEANPGLRVRVAYRRNDFSLFEYWSTPNFYVLRDGEVVSRLEGWPQGRTTLALRKALERGGVRIPSEPPNNFHFEGSEKSTP